MSDSKCPKCGRPSNQNVMKGCQEFDPVTGQTTLNLVCLGCLTEYKEVVA